MRILSAAVCLLLLATPAVGANRTKTISKIDVAKFSELHGVRVKYHVPKKIDGIKVATHELHFYKADPKKGGTPGPFTPLEPALYRNYQKNKMTIQGHGKGHVDLDFGEVLNHPDATLSPGQVVKVVHVLKGESGQVLNVDTATRDTRNQTRRERLRYNDWVDGLPVIGEGAY